MQTIQYQSISTRIAENSLKVAAKSDTPKT